MSSAACEYTFSSLIIVNNYVGHSLLDFKLSCLIIIFIEESEFKLLDLEEIYNCRIILKWPYSYCFIRCSIV